jgi:hypothetical protein
VIQGYLAWFPDQPRIVVAQTRDAAGVDAAVGQAVTRAEQVRAVQGRVVQVRAARLWLVRIHLTAEETLSWDAALRRRGLRAERVEGLGLAVASLP